MDNFTALPVAYFKLLKVNCLVVYSIGFEVTLSDFIAFTVSKQKALI